MYCRLGLLQLCHLPLKLGPACPARFEHDLGTPPRPVHSWLSNAPMIPRLIRTNPTMLAAPDRAESYADETKK